MSKNHGREPIYFPFDLVSAPSLRSRLLGRDFGRVGKIVGDGGECGHAVLRQKARHLRALCAGIRRSRSWSTLPKYLEYRHRARIEAIARGGHEITLSAQFADLCERRVAHDIACRGRVVRAARRDLGLS